MATDERVIYYDRKPLFTAMDEISYRVVSGIKVASQGDLTSLTLHTRIGDYTIRLANPASAEAFAHFIEKRALENHGSTTPSPSSKPSLKPTKITKSVLEFLQAHEVGVISTIDRGGNVHGAAIYYLVYDPETIYFITKLQTNKAQNLLVNGQVALTVYDEHKLRLAQIQAYAEQEADKLVASDVFSKLIKSRNYEGEERLPPITQKNAGEYICVKLTPTSISYQDYKSM